MSNVLSDDKRQQVLALGRLGWTLRRIEQATGVRRETASNYLKAVGIEVHPPGRRGRRGPAKAAIQVTTDSEAAKPAIEVITDFCWEKPPKPAIQVTTGSEAAKPAIEVITVFCWEKPRRPPTLTLHAGGQSVPSLGFLRARARRTDNFRQNTQTADGWFLNRSMLGNSKTR